MEEIQYKQELGRNYIVLPYIENDIREYLSKMITENRIDGLLNSKVGYDKNKHVIMYDITGKISLRKEYDSKNIDIKSIRKLFESITNVINKSEEYLLDEKFFIIDPDYIFLDIEDDTYSFLYSPFHIKSKDMLVYENRFYRLADFLIDRIDNHCDQAVNIAYNFYRMSKENDFSIRTFINIVDKEKIIEKKEKEIIIPSENEGIEKESFEINKEAIDETIKNKWILPIVLYITCVGVVIYYYFWGRRWEYSTIVLAIAIFIFAIGSIQIIKNIVEVIEKKRMDEIVFPNSPVSVEEFWDSDKTMYFDDKTQYFGINSNENNKRIIEWIEKGTNKKYVVDKFPVVIGKLLNEVDLFIDDASISRMHLKIYERQGKLSAVDLNSTNGTTIDGKVLIPGQEVDITYQSEMRLGNVTLRFV